MTYRGPCRGNIDRLVALLDGGLRPGTAERLQAHLERCEACAEAHRRLRAARDALRRIGDEEPPELNYRQVETQIRWQMARPASRGERRRGIRLGHAPALAGLTATLIVGVVGGMLLQHHRGARVGPPPEQPAVARVRESIVTPPTELAALVTLLSGNVRVATEDGVVGPLEISRPLLPGERVMTEHGELVLQWAAGCGLRLRRNSEVRLVRLDSQRQRILLLRGGIDVQVARNAAGRWSFAVEGGGLRAAVKGTSFSLVLADHATEIDVREGLVAVSPVGRTGWQATLPPGYDGQLAADGTIDLLAGYRLRLLHGGPTVTVLPDGDRPVALNLLPSWPSLQWLIAMTGPLEVNSRPPGADVDLDSVRVGRTDLTLRSAIGRHLVEVWRGSRLLRRQWVLVGTGGTPAQVSIDERAVSARRAGLPPSIYGVFQRRAVTIRACYERALKRTPDLEGRLLLRLSISDAGEVTDARLDADSIADPNVGRCALATVKRWRFPPGRGAEIVYPLMLRPDSP